jgi:hypothetical protein
LWKSILDDGRVIDCSCQIHRIYQKLVGVLNLWLD